MSDSFSQREMRALASRLLVARANLAYEVNDRVTVVGEILKTLAGSTGPVLTGFVFGLSYDIPLAKNPD